MSIDWFTILAQILNFIILLIFLNRFLFKPVLAGMKEKKIKADEMEKLYIQRTIELEVKEKGFETRLRSFVTNKDASFREVKAEIEQYKNRLKEEAIFEVNSLKEVWNTNLEKEMAALELRIKTNVLSGLTVYIKNILVDLADIDLEEKIISKFLMRIESLKESEVLKIKDIILHDQGIIIETTFVLEDNLKEIIQKKFQSQLGNIPKIQYIQRPELIAGIRLKSMDYEISWNIDDTLKSKMKMI